MKKVLLMAGIIGAALFINGCALLHSGYSVAGGFPRTMPGILMSNQISGGYMAPKLASTKDIIILGHVSSEVSAVNGLLLISSGDASIMAAKSAALKKYPQADDIVNVEIDVKHEGILGIFNTVTMYYRGIAIKYKK